MRRRGTRAAVALAATGLALVAAELAWRGLRTRGFGPTTNPHYVEADPRLGWRYRPGAELRHTSADFDVAVRINAEGFRDASTAAAGQRPIVTLGDSFTFGWGVEEREAFPALLEEASGVPVDNLGVSGFGTGQEVRLFEALGAPRAPRAVVLTVCPNDVEEVGRDRMYGRSKPLYDPAADRFGDPEPEGWLRRHSHLWRSLTKAREARRTRPLGPDEVTAGREAVVRLLERLAAGAAEAGARLVVQAWDDPWLAERSAGRGWLYLDLAPALDRASREAPVTFAGDSHWNPRGHRVVAEALGALLRDHGLVP